MSDGQIRRTAIISPKHWNFSQFDIEQLIEIGSKQLWVFQYFIIVLNILYLRLLLDTTLHRKPGRIIYKGNRRKIINYLYLFILK